jgi:hypothetical protein
VTDRLDICIAVPVKGAQRASDGLPSGDKLWGDVIAAGLFRPCAPILAVLPRQQRIAKAGEGARSRAGARVAAQGFQARDGRQDRNGLRYAEPGGFFIALRASDGGVRRAGYEDVERQGRERS